MVFAGATKELLSARATIASPDGRTPGLGVLCPEVSLGGTRFTGAPFLGRKKAHARAEAFVVARGLAGILERGVAARFVPARARLAC
jgi:hypothetical protein